MIDDSLLIEDFRLEIGNPRSTIINRQRIKDQQSKNIQ